MVPLILAFELNVISFTLNLIYQRHFVSPETIFLNFQAISKKPASWPGGRYNNPIPTWFLASIDCSKIPSLFSFPLFNFFLLQHSFRNYSKPSLFALSLIISLFLLYLLLRCFFLSTSLSICTFITPTHNYAHTYIPELEFTVKINPESINLGFVIF